MPLGRAAMSMSFSRARIMRSVEVRGASPAFIEALSWSVNCSRRPMARPPRKNTPYYMQSDAAVMLPEKNSHSRRIRLHWEISSHSVAAMTIAWMPSSSGWAAPRRRRA